MEKNSHLNCSTSSIIQQQNDHLFLCKLENIHIINNTNNNKVLLSSSDDHHLDDHDHDDGMINGDDDGFKTPTGSEHRIPVNLTTPPPAPMKIKSKPMKRRRCARRPEFYQQLSFQDLELLFPPQTKNVGNDSSAASINSNDNTKQADKFTNLVISLSSNF